VAFAVGSAWTPGNPIAIVGTHTDSPVLKVKPVSSSSKVGFLQVGVEAYGGGIWHTWFDRDLSVAGRLMVRDGNGGFEQKLVKVEKPIVRVPTLAIHLHRESNFDPNKETELYPITGLIAAELNRGKGDSEDRMDEGDEADDNAEKSVGPLKPLSERHHPYFLETVASAAGVKADAIVDFELILYDTQKSCIGGLNDEFIFSARLDNQEMTFCAIEGIIRSVEETKLDDEATIRLVACFDNEEIGSKSAQGADSDLFPAVLRRLSALPSPLAHVSNSPDSDESYENLSRKNTHTEGTSTAFEQTLATSFLVSADMAHSVHPNYAAKHEANHRPEMNRGTVIKVNANQRYMTNSPGIVLLQEVARRASVPLQLFVGRNDVPCGSTIGPLLGSKTGIRTLDLGNPQLSMHSIRETGGSHDIEHGIRLFAAFFEHYGELEAKILVD
jgi:aspartyl aminopeptidase